MHIPEPKRHLVRYYGWYSNVSRGTRKLDEEGVSEGNESPACCSALAAKGGREGRAMRRAWAQLIKRIYEVDPLVCPTCGAEMKIIAFITENEVVTKILKHLTQKAETENSRGPPEAAGFAAAS
jgi:hypothetical protein